MKFLYKIHSGYDGFYPQRLPDRMVGRNLLRLRWDRYIDVVEEGSEVWVYFHGPHAFENGVYVQGFIQSIAANRRSVTLRVRKYDTQQPVTDRDTSARVAAVVRPRYRQVFLLPEEWAPVQDCSIGSTAESCRHRRCETCPAWKALQLIQPDSYSWPSRLPETIGAYVPAYLVIPSRCYLGRRVGLRVRNTSELFYRFKLGEEALAYPLALGIFEALRQRRLLDFDAIVPVPLSPEKAERGEVNRTLLLARELSRLLDARTLPVLRLRSAFSKKAALASGATPIQFEQEYYEKLAVVDEAEIPARVLLVDDVCTKGSTLRSARRRIAEVNPDCSVVAATVGQMILKGVVVDENPLVSN